ncbi:antitoxin [Cronobacter turicensis]
MAMTKLRQQGGAVVLTIPVDIAAQAGWNVGMELDVTASGNNINIAPISRIPRGRRTIDQILSGIDSDEIRAMNEASEDGLNDAPRGRELI